MHKQRCYSTYIACKSCCFVCLLLLISFLPLSSGCFKVLATITEQCCCLYFREIGVCMFGADIACKMPHTDFLPESPSALCINLHGCLTSPLSRSDPFESSASKVNSTHIASKVNSTHIHTRLVYNPPSAIWRVAAPSVAGRITFQQVHSTHSVMTRRFMIHWIWLFGGPARHILSIIAASSTMNRGMVSWVVYMGLLMAIQLQPGGDLYECMCNFFLHCLSHCVY